MYPPSLASVPAQGIQAVVVFRPYRWTPTDWAVLETVMRRLGLALEGARSVAQLAAEQRLGIISPALEGFSYNVSFDVCTPVRHILGFHTLLRKS